MTKRRAKSPDWVHRAEPAQGIERIEAFFIGNAYAMHRHDTYAIGRTPAGVQCFQYRRSAVAAGFADQSHMTRHFTKTYGIPPARWLRMVQSANGR